MVRRGATILMAHELLRQATLILAAGWCKGADASEMRDAYFHYGPALRRPSYCAKRR